MMSPKKAKEHCGYIAKPEHNTCSNCGAFASDFIYPIWVVSEADRAKYDIMRYAKLEKNLRCTDHGFAVKKTATCGLWRKRSSPGAL
jgi:hypothetical protein